MPNIKKDGWNCNCCNMNFPTRRKLAAHKKDNECYLRKIKKYKCVGCNKMFATKTQKSNHQAICNSAIEIANKNRKREVLKNLTKLKEYYEKNPEKRKEFSIKGTRMAASKESVRKIRSETLIRLNKTENFRNKASITARKTSSRKDIIESRTNVLKKWREKNPEKIQEILEKGRKIGSLHRISREEDYLWNYVIDKEKFERSVTIICKEESKKEVDFVSKKEDIFIEVDGCWHFGMDFVKKKMTRYNPDKIHKRDLMLIDEIEKRGNLLIRIDAGCFANSGIRRLKLEWEKIFNIIINKKNISGIYLLGNFYLQSNLWLKLKDSWNCIYDAEDFLNEYNKKKNNFL